MKEAQFVSILAHPRLDFCAEVATNQSKQLIIAYSLKGQNANSFCKDLVNHFAAWEIQSPEQLHQNILDLLAFARQKELEIEFALSLLQAEQVIFATYSGQVILQRNGQVRQLLASTAEVKIVLGPFRENDHIILINQAGNILAQEILNPDKFNLEQNSLEKVVSELSLIKEEQKDSKASLAMITYQDKVIQHDVEVKKTELVGKKLLVIFNQLHKVGEKIYYYLKKISGFLKKNYTWLKKQNKKKLLMGLIIVLAVCGGGIGVITLIKQQNQKVILNIQTKITAINSDIQNIDQLVSQQPLAAREKAQNSLQAIEALKTEKNNRSSLQLIEEESKKLQNIINQISGENSLDRLSIAFNLENFLGSKIEVSEQNFFILENNGQEILQITADQKKEKITLDNKAQIRDFSVSENKLFVLSNGLKMLDLKGDKQTFTEIKPEGESDKTAEHLSSFGPYLYLLNKDKRNVYRYYYNNDKLSDPIGWLVDKQGINFDGLSDLIVDGDLWLGDKTGKIWKFTKGYTTDFQITGLSNLPNSAVALSSKENSQVLVVLEKQNKRLLVLTKDGQLINEIKSNELAGVSSIALSDDGNKVYALSGSVVYEVEI